MAVLEGASNREIAQKLGLGEQTVKNHLSNIFDKLGVSSRLELALYAVHHRLAGGEAPAWLTRTQYFRTLPTQYFRPIAPAPRLGRQ